MSFFAHELSRVMPDPSASDTIRQRRTPRSLIMHYAMLLSTEQNQARQLPDHHEFACRDESVWSWLYRHLRIALHGCKQA
jgi:hypothetical protein